MRTKSKTSAPSRKKSTPKSNVLPLSPERIKESKQRAWERELYDFLEPLSEAEFELARKLLDIICKKPNRRKEPCEVIQFAKEFNHKNSFN